MSYRHCTNLHKPFDALDQRFLDALLDWKEGPPVSVEPQPDQPFNPKPFDQLVKDGIVGIYTTQAALSRPHVKKLTGWDKPMLILGKELPPDAVHT